MAWDLWEWVVAVNGSIDNEIVLFWFQLGGGTTGLVLLAGLLIQLGRLLENWKNESHTNKRDHKIIFVYLDGLFDHLKLDRGDVNKMARDAGLENSGSKRRRE